MPGGSAKLVIHGAPASQPSRAVYWTCLIQRLPFELRAPGMDDLGPGGPLLDLNPSGQMPVVEDGDFAIFEMPAILIYLCEKHQWKELLPQELRARTRVHQYLHFHHNFTREATWELMAPHVTVAFPVRVAGAPFAARLEDPDKLEKGRAGVARIAELIERGFFREGAPYLCGSQPTIADIACYEELGQLRWADLYHFEGFAKIRRWLDEMESLPFHDEAHRYNTVLGDIRTKPNTMERFLAANGAGIEAVAGIA